MEIRVVGQRRDGFDPGCCGVGVYVIVAKMCGDQSVGFIACTDRVGLREDGQQEICVR